MKRSAICFLAMLTLASAIGCAQSQPAPATPGSVNPGPTSPGVVQLRYVTILVKGYDEALTWYTGVPDLKKVEDRSYGPTRRWLVVAPEGQNQPGIVLDVPHSDISSPDRMGKETNWVFVVADCAKFYEALNARGVHFIQPPRRQPWGTTQAIFADPYGNIFVAESQPASSSANPSGAQ
jgi:catechol 2,3-dioxygenase-like lactoylglutathione lyase family enzyme